MQCTWTHPETIQPPPPHTDPGKYRLPSNCTWCQKVGSHWWRNNLTLLQGSKISQINVPNQSECYLPQPWPDLQDVIFSPSPDGGMCQLLSISIYTDPTITLSPASILYRWNSKQLFLLKGKDRPFCLFISPCSHLLHSECSLDRSQLYKEKHTIIG